MRKAHIIIGVLFVTMILVLGACAPPAAPAPTPTPAAFSLSNLTIRPAEVQPGEDVTVSVDITNTGGTEGSYTATLMINGVEEVDKSVTVAAGATKTVTFSVTREDAVSYNVVVDGLIGSFTVVTLAPTPTPAEPKPTYEVNGVKVEYSSIDDEVGDVNTDFIDISQASIKQVSKDYLQLDMRLGTKDIPFIPNKQNYLWILDTDSSRSGDEFVMRLNAVSGSGVKDTWHMWIESMIEKGRGIYHFPAAKFDDTFSALVPLQLLNNPDRITWKARAEYLGEFDETPSLEHRLDYIRNYPNLSIGSDAQRILSEGAFFNNLSNGGLISFSIEGFDEESVEYFSSYEKRLFPVSNNQFQGNGNGISMVFARVNGYYLVPKPLVIANGNYKLEGENTAFVFNTAKDYDQETMYILDTLSGIQRDLVGFYPHNGQLLIVEESDSNVLASPNTEFPIPIPLYVPNSPDNSWFYFTHEYGHHFHGGNPRITQLLKDFYGESIPSLIAYFTMEEVVTNPSKYGIPASKLETILSNLSAVKNNFLKDLSKYKEQGSPFEKLQVWPPSDSDPNNVYDGMMLKIQDLYGREAVRKFFEIFQPPEGFDVHLLKEIQPKNQDQKHTVFVAAWSVATNADLRPLFGQWNYPIDEVYYGKVHPELSKIVGLFSGFYGFPERFFEESSLTREQVVKVVDAQYLSLKKMHNGISPYDFCKIEYESDVYGSTTPYGIKLGDFAFPSLNSGNHRWEVMAHEQGHNFFGGTSWFYYTMAAPHAFLQESLAVLSAFYTYHDILTNQQAYGIDDNSIDSLVFDFTNGRTYQEEMYNEYIRKGKNFDIDDVLTSQALDFKMITYGEKYGWDKFERLAKAFENELGRQFTFLDDGASAIEQSTYIVAALSAAFDQDFRQEFKDLNFPIDDLLYQTFFAIIKQYID